jgi:misacylated tRNA(Ala) deacylase
MESLDGTYKKEFEAEVTAIFPGIVELNQTAFYHLGGGQPADTGTLVWDDGRGKIFDVRKKNRIRHMIKGDLPDIGTTVKGSLDWERRYSHMRMHTSQHLVSAVVSERYGSDTVGNQIGVEKSRIDFKPLKLGNTELNMLQDEVNQVISKDLKISISESERSDLENNPEIRSSMSSGLWKMLPSSITRLRVVKIGNIDVCPCAGTHVRSLSEIGDVEFLKKDNKGSEKIRLSYKLND